ncbi:MAG: pyrroline-5-carboxylate reductase [Spirochaetales bacterium]|nr:pyrroline-5-carboxylate reductase [Spirochaetales bacterium]
MKLGIIGIGNMGGAIAQGLIARKSHFEIIVAEKMQDRLTFAEKQLKLGVLDKKELVRTCDLTIIAIKPQECENLFNELGNTSHNQHFISIAAGKSIDYFKQGLKAASVTRFMPNLAAMVGESVVGMTTDPSAPENIRMASLEIASAIGKAVELPESLIPAITGLSGSGIAFVFAFIHAMSLGGTLSGIAYNQSLEITLGTVKGAIKVLEENKINPIDMLSKVISPAGTTIEGIAQLEKNQMTYGVMEAINKASQRAKELEG